MFLQTLVADLVFFRNLFGRETRQHHGSTGSGSAGGGDLADTDDEDEDELPVEMQGLSMSSVTGQHEPSNANRLPPTKRLKRSSSSSTAASNGDRKTAPARTRGRGRGRSLRGGKGRAASGKGKGKGKANGARLDMDDVFHEEGSDEGDDEGVAGGLAGARGAGAGATVLDTVVWKLGIDRVCLLLLLLLLYLLPSFLLFLSLLLRMLHVCCRILFVGGVAVYLRCLKCLMYGVLSYSLLLSPGDMVKLEDTCARKGCIQPHELLRVSAARIFIIYAIIECRR